MTLHIVNLGSLSGRVQKFTDMNGWIPERGSRWQEFEWPHSQRQMFSDTRQGITVWKRFLNQAIAATTIALEALEDLHDRRHR